MRGNMVDRRAYFCPRGAEQPGVERHRLARRQPSVHVLQSGSRSDWGQV